jgi:predicted short-subunit dehydrogenase-like oxidoreductase (DUF2520 family)
MHLRLPFNLNRSDFQLYTKSVQVKIPVPFKSAAIYNPRKTPHKKAVMAFIVNIIGAGNLGKTIGCLMHKNALVEIGSICNTSKESALSAIRFIGAGKYCANITELPPADMTFITTPDRMISEVCQTFSHNQQIKKESLVVHCSGVLTTNELMSAKNLRP